MGLDFIKASKSGTPHDDQGSRLQAVLGQSKPKNISITVFSPHSPPYIFYAICVEHLHNTHDHCNLMISSFILISCFRFYFNETKTVEPAITLRFTLVALFFSGYQLFCVLLI